MTPDSQEPTTEAGRALLADLPRTAWVACADAEMSARILAIEAEARADANLIAHAPADLAALLRVAEAAREWNTCAICSDGDKKNEHLDLRNAVAALDEPEG